MTRVLLDCRMADWSGVGRYTTGLTRALAARDDIEIVQLVDASGSVPVPEAQTVTATSHPFTPAGGLEFGRISRRVAPDLTHCLHFPTPVPSPHPLVVTVHDLTPLIVPSVMRAFPHRFGYRWWNGRLARIADVILANSENTARDIVRFFPEAAAKTTVIPHTAEGFAEGPMGALPPGLLAKGERYVLSMGNTKPHKDLPTLLRAFAQLAPAYPDVRLLLVGKVAPGYVAGVLGDDPAVARVAFTGRVDDETLRALYAGAAAFAFPSLYEGFGLPPLEAMTLGTPVVSSNAASLPEVVGDAALIFDAGDAQDMARNLERLLTDSLLERDLRARGRAHAALFTWSRTADATAAAYRALLERD